MGPVAKLGVLLVVGAALLIALVGGLAYLVARASDSRLSQTVNAPLESITVPSDITSVQYGQHLAGAIALCTSCHGSAMAGHVIRDDTAARIAAPNLTRGTGGIGSTRSDMELARAIREGVSPGGRLLLMMPTENYSRLSDADLGALVAFIRSLPGVDSALPPNEIRAVGRLQFALGRLTLVTAPSVDASVPRAAAPTPGLTAEYGEYLTAVAGCSGCHGAALTGGSRGPDITSSAFANWSDADFLRAMRTGRRPDGRALAQSMPWQYYAQMSELELRAIWSYLEIVPGV